MESKTNVSQNKVPFGQKVAFGLGMLANQMFPAMIGIFVCSIRLRNSRNWAVSKTG